MSACSLAQLAGKRVTVYLEGGQTLDGIVRKSDLTGETVLDKGQDGEIFIFTQSIIACWVWRGEGV